MHLTLVCPLRTVLTQFSGAVLSLVIPSGIEIEGEERQIGGERDREKEREGWRKPDLTPTSSSMTPVVRTQHSSTVHSTETCRCIRHTPSQ